MKYILTLILYSFNTVATEDPDHILVGKKIGGVDVNVIPVSLSNDNKVQYNINECVGAATRLTLESRLDQTTNSCTNIPRNVHVDEITGGTNINSIDAFGALSGEPQYIPKVLGNVNGKINLPAGTRFAEK